MTKNIGRDWPSEKVVLFAALAAATGTIMIAAFFGDKIVGLTEDDAWFMWKAWHLRIDGGVDDPLYNTGLGLALFGWIWVELLGFVYALSDWQLGGGHVIASSCIVASSGIWYSLGRKLNLQYAQCAVLAALLIVLVPFFRSSLSARPEAFVWFLTSVAVLLLSNGYYVVAGFISGLAIESSQMGIVSLAYCAAWQARARWPNSEALSDLIPSRPYLRYGSGLFGAGLLYIALHLSPLEHAGLAATGARVARELNWGTPFADYILHPGITDLWSDLITLGALTVYLFARTWRYEPLPLYIAVFVSVAFVLEPHRDMYYFLYFFACIPFALVSVFSSTRSLAILVASLTAVSWTGYMIIAIESWDFSMNRFKSELVANLDGTRIPIIADPNFWPVIHDWGTLLPLDQETKLLAAGNPFDLVLNEPFKPEFKIPESSSRSVVNSAGMRKLGSIILTGGTLTPRTQC